MPSRKTAVVTGASSGIGKEISSRLLSLGYKVIGISRNIKEVNFPSEHFSPLSADLSDEKSTLQICELLKNEDIHIKLGLEKNFTTGKLEINIQFDTNAPNFNKDNDVYNFSPSYEE